MQLANDKTEFNWTEGRQWTTADCQSKQTIKRVAELLWTSKGNPGPSKVHEKLIIWQEYLTALFDRQTRVAASGVKMQENTLCLILIVRKCYKTLLCRRFCRESMVFWWQRSRGGV